jgi:cobalt-zinc-cadmium efflux system protein
MSHHDPNHSHISGGEKSLILALAITASWFVIELAGGIYANSLALLADAAHMLTDLAALGLSLFALKISARPATQEKTYGWLRAEILAALANGIFLILIGIYIFYESYRRFLQPPEVKSGPMLVVATTGLLANLATARLLYRSRNESLNLRGAFLHVLGDTLGSIGAIVAGILMMLRQWYLADPVVSTIVGGLVIYSSWELVAESVDVLLEGTPSHLKSPACWSTSAPFRACPLHTSRGPSPRRRWR